MRDDVVFCKGKVVKQSICSQYAQHPGAHHYARRVASCFPKDGFFIESERLRVLWIIRCIADTDRPIFNG